jgi:hypothetical protein
VCYRKLQAMSKTRGSNSYRIFGWFWITILMSASNVRADQQSPPPISAAPVTINLTYKSVHPQTMICKISRCCFAAKPVQRLPGSW